eukprot:scaffold91807_cov52-Phaeocystis_antarctica.AAC.3
MGPDQSVGPGGLATPGTGGCLRALPQQSDALLAFRADGGVVWSTDGDAPRPPRVVFVLGFASLIHSLTSGKKHLQYMYTNVVVVVVLSAYPARTRVGGDFLKKKLGFAIESCKRLNLVSD